MPNTLAYEHASTQAHQPCNLADSRKNCRATKTKTKNDNNTINELYGKIQSSTNKNNALKQENRIFKKMELIELMQRGIDKEQNEEE